MCGELVFFHAAAGDGSGFDDSFPPPSAYLHGCVWHPLLCLVLSRDCVGESQQPLAWLPPRRRRKVWSHLALLHFPLT